MATKKFIIEVEEGETKYCENCPLLLLDCTEQGISCAEYNLATMRVKEPMSYEELREFASQYSHNIWEQLMLRFKEDDKFCIGANDVSDYVLNAILDTYQKMMEEEKCKE